MPDERALPSLTRTPASLNGKLELVVSALLALLAAGLYLPILVRMLGAYDYVQHLRAAQVLSETGNLITPHMLFHVLTAVLSRLFGEDIRVAGLAVLLSCVAVTILAIWWLCLRSLPMAEPAVLCMLAALPFVAPLTLLYGVDRHLYFGYIGINVFHNPTMLILKPFSLLLFGLSCKIVTGDESGSRRLLLLLALPVVVVCCALAKPSYLICFLPALTLLVLIRAARKEKVDWILFLGVLLPAVLVLSLQYNLTYSPDQISGFYEGQSQIVVAPFEVVGHFSSFLLPKFLLSIAFPLSVWVLYRRSSMKNVSLALAWLTFGIGAFQMYFLKETGIRAYQGNFGWSAQIALFVLFVASAVHLLKNAGQLKRERGWDLPYIFCLGIFVLHLLSGGVFYGAEYSQTERFW